MKEYPLDEITCMGGWFMPENLCDDIIDYFNSNTNLHQKGMVGHGSAEKNAELKTLSDVKKSTDLYISQFEGQDPFTRYRDLLQQCLNNYMKKYIHVDELKKFNINEPYNIQYYKPNEGFKVWHFENPDRIDRFFAFMTYLNNCDDGGTEFKYQNLTTPAKKGLTLIWPANWTHTHKGQISKTKEKYIVTGWYTKNA